jgi:hypothetical protein
MHQRLQRADLIGDVVGQLGLRAVDEPPAEAREVAVADVRADGDPGRDRGARRAGDPRRIACVETAGDVRARDVCEHRRVVAHRPRTERFADVAVEVHQKIRAPCTGP